MEAFNQAHVRNGRLVLDEPTLNGRLNLDAPPDLPEGVEVMLVIDDSEKGWKWLIAPSGGAGTRRTDEEREAIEKYRRGESKLIPHEEVRRKLAARSAK